MMLTKQKLERAIGALVVKAWILDGPGPARFGWGAVHPGRTRYLGRTLAEITATLEDR